MHDNHLTYCHFCPWSGVSKNYEKRIVHDNTHFRVRPFKCEYCSDKFYRIDDKNNHVEARHERIFEKYKCEHCEYLCDIKSTLVKHKRYKHSKMSNVDFYIPDESGL